jgi:hypothetical protein
VLGDGHARSGSPWLRVSGTAGALVFLQGRIANDVRVRPRPDQHLVAQSRQRSQTAWLQRMVLPTGGAAAAGVQGRYRAPWDVVAFAVTRRPAG